MDVEILEVTNFPKELLGKQVIRDKETQETYINKNLYGKFANEFIQEKGLKFTEQDMFEFADWYCNGLSNAERKTPKEMFPEYVKIRQEIG